MKNWDTLRDVSIWGLMRILSRNGAKVGNFRCIEGTLFHFARAGHEFADSIAGGLAILQNGVHLLRNGHFHTEFLRQPHGPIGGHHTLAHLAIPTGNDLTKLTAFAHTPNPLSSERA